MNEFSVEYDQLSFIYTKFYFIQFFTINKKITIVDNIYSNFRAIKEILIRVKINEMHTFVEQFKSKNEIDIEKN